MSDCDLYFRMSLEDDVDEDAPFGMLDCIDVRKRKIKKKRAFSEHDESKLCCIHCIEYQIDHDFIRGIISDVMTSTPPPIINAEIDMQDSHNTDEVADEIGESEVNAQDNEGCGTESDLALDGETNMTILVNPSISLIEFLDKYLSYDGRSWPKLGEEYYSNSNLEKLDILGASDSLAQINSTPYDLDSLIIVASKDQMINMEFSMAKIYSSRIRQWVSLPKGRSDLEVPLPDGSSKFVSECRSRLLFSATWGDIGRVQVFALKLSEGSMNAFMSDFEEALCEGMRKTNLIPKSDAPYDRGSFKTEVPVHYRGIQPSFMKEVFERLKQNTDIIFYIVGHDLKRTQRDNVNVNSVFEFVHGDVLASRIDVGFQFYAADTEKKRAVLPNPVNLNERIQNVSNEFGFSWEKFDVFRLLGTNDIVGISATNKVSSFKKLKFYCSTLEHISTNPHGLLLHQYMFNIDQELKRDRVVRRFLKNTGTSNASVEESNDYLDRVIGNIMKSGSQRWCYRVEVTVDINSVPSSVAFLDRLRQEMIPSMIVLKSSWIALHTCLLIESLRSQGNDLVQKCSHRVFEKANTLAVVTEILRNYVTGCKPASKKFSKQLRIVGLFDSIRTCNLPRVTFPKCHVDPVCFMDSSYFIGIKLIASNMVDASFRVELACLVIFTEAIRNNTTFSNMRLCQMVLMQYLAWTFSSLKKGHLIKKWVHFRLGPYSYVPKKYMSQPKFDVSCASNWSTKTAKIPEKFLKVKCKDFLKEEFFREKGRSYQSLIKLIMEQYRIEKSKMEIMLRQMLLGQKDWNLFIIPKTASNKFRKEYKIVTTITKLKFEENIKKEERSNGTLPKSLQPGSFFPYNDLTKEESEAVWQYLNKQKHNAKIVIEYEVKTSSKVEWKDEEIAVALSVKQKKSDNVYKPLFASILGGFVRRDGRRIVIRRSLDAMKYKMNTLGETGRDEYRRFAKKNRLLICRGILNYALLGYPYQDRNLKKSDKKTVTNFVDDRSLNPIRDYLRKVGIKKVSEDLMNSMKLFGGEIDGFHVMPSTVDFEVIYFDSNVPSIFREDFSFLFRHCQDSSNEVAADSDPESSEEETAPTEVLAESSLFLPDKYMEVNYHIIDVDPDGNCGFHVFAGYLELTQRELRLLMINEVENNTDFYNLSFGGFLANAETLLNKLNRFGVNLPADYWYDLDCSTILANMLRRPIVIISDEVEEMCTAHVPLRPRKITDPDDCFEPLIGLHCYNHYKRLIGRLRLYPKIITYHDRAVIAQEFTEFAQLHSVVVHTCQPPPMYVEQIL